MPTPKRARSFVAPKENKIEPSALNDAVPPYLLSVDARPRFLNPSRPSSLPPDLPPSVPPLSR